jgi:hypothetical protein
MSDDRVDLMHDRLQTDEVLKSFLEGFVPLPVAAATTFHQAHGNSKAIVSRQDYDDALNIAAAALSRLIPIYVIRDPREGRIALAFDLTKQHFARGATELRFHGGTAPLRDLSIRRSDLLSALSLIKRTGLPFSFAFMPPLLQEEQEADAKQNRKAADIVPRHPPLGSPLRHDP